MTRLGLLLTLTEPPPAMEEEFNAWYDTEHLAERLSIPGFRSARRWACEQIEPGDAGPHPDARAVVYSTAGLSVPGGLQTRRFAAASGETITLLELGQDPRSLPAGVLLYRAYAA